MKFDLVNQDLVFDNCPNSFKDGSVQNLSKKYQK